MIKLQMHWRTSQTSDCGRQRPWQPTQGVAINAPAMEGVLRAVRQLRQFPVSKGQQPSAPPLHLLTAMQRDMDKPL